MKEILFNVLAGFLGGLLVYLYQKFDEEKKSKNFIKENLKSSLKKLPSNFIHSIEVGMTMDKLKEFIGNPTFSTFIDEKEIFDLDNQFNINQYKFLNCELIVFNSENSLLGFILKPYIENYFEFERFDSANEQLNIGGYIVDDTFTNFDEILYEKSMRDTWFGIIEYYGRIGGFNYYCYYGETGIFADNPTLEDLKGEIISGYGVASHKTFFKYYG
ncbi:hypothetical protein [Epilithonimonas hominis]|uniref:hypothetical protein n=1 Tax=Epilithonimonas hominis TaxID=420404 RepID=UPI0028A09C5C|nr:hypothetical protein [Epilithonimonas hominis]